MIIGIASLLTVAVIVYILAVRAKDLPPPQPVSPFQHLDERKAAIYENLRDLWFEYLVGKLSDQDYQQTKLDLQKELATIMAEVDRLKAELNSGARPAPSAPAPDRLVCPACGAQFQQALKFCGECGKPIRAVGT